MNRIILLGLALLVVSCQNKSKKKKDYATSGATKIVNLKHYPKERQS